MLRLAQSSQEAPRVDGKNIWPLPRARQRREALPQSARARPARSSLQRGNSMGRPRAGAPKKSNRYLAATRLCFTAARLIPLAIAPSFLSAAFSSRRVAVKIRAVSVSPSSLAWAMTVP
jgi:hypothetical protein